MRTNLGQSEGGREDGEEEGEREREVGTGTGKGVVGHLTIYFHFRVFLLCVL